MTYLYKLNLKPGGLASDATALPQEISHPNHEHVLNPGNRNCDGWGVNDACEPEGRDHWLLATRLCW